HAVVREQSDADTSRRTHLTRFQAERRREGIEHPLRQHGGLLGAVKLFDDHGEFIASYTRYRVGLAHTAAQTRGDLSQQFVSRIMAKGVVDSLETVRVEEEHCHQCFVASRA